MAGDVDYMLRVAVADMAEYDAFYKRLIAMAPMKNVTSRFAMERMKNTAAYPLHPRAFRDRARWAIMATRNRSPRRRATGSTIISRKQK